MDLSEKKALCAELAHTADYFSQRICQLIENALSEYATHHGDIFYVTDQMLRNAIREYLENHR